MDARDEFDKVFPEILKKQASLKRKLLMTNHASYVSKAVRNATMKRSSLEKKYLKKEPKKLAKKQKTIVVRRLCKKE